jgi:YD repeat-containing protein
VGSTGSMKRNRPELVGVTQVKDNSATATRFACHGRGVFVRRKDTNKIS